MEDGDAIVGLTCESLRFSGFPLVDRIFKAGNISYSQPCLWNQDKMLGKVMLYRLFKYKNYRYPCPFENPICTFVFITQKKLFLSYLFIGEVLMGLTNSYTNTIISVLSSGHVLRAVVVKEGGLEGCLLQLTGPSLRPVIVSDMLMILIIY